MAVICTMSTTLSERIIQLQADRKRHAAAIAAIDQALQEVTDALQNFRELCPTTDEELLQIGMATEQIRLVRRRGRFSRTAEASVLDFIRQNHSPTTAEINAHWRAESRCGTANVTLLKLLKQGAIQRVQDSSVRGSRYIAAAEFSPPDESPAQIPQTDRFDSIHLTHSVDAYQQL
jgi:hypothetical protein